jgi:hypothetical protein
MTTTSSYEALAAPFARTYRDTRGGVELTYITAEQVVSRLNEVLGPGGWSFRIVEHGRDAEADELWCLGELLAVVDGQQTVRQQFGSARVKRSGRDGKPLDLGNDLKAAASDALKKCAWSLGVGLYLSRKPAPAPVAQRRAVRAVGAR